MMAVNPRTDAEDSAFMASMPTAYAHAFTLRETQEHARIVAQRGTQLAHVEACSGALDSAFVCVVADDRPGLLSLVTDALLVHGLNIVSAQVYCRRRADGKYEAVDFFRLESRQARGLSTSIDPEQVAAFGQTLRELIAEAELVSQPPSERDTIPVPAQKPSRVYFDIDALRHSEFVLIVEVPDFAGLLFAVSSTLHEQSIRILSSEVRTEGGVARDRFTLMSVDAEPLSAERMCDVQQAVHAAVSAARSANP